MQEKEMLNCLLAVWENMTEDKDREAYKEMLVLLDNMRYFRDRRKFCVIDKV